MANCWRVTSIVLMVMALIIGAFACVFPGWRGAEGPQDIWVGLWWHCVGDEFDSDHCNEWDIDFGDDDQASLNAVRILDPVGVGFLVLAFVFSCCSAVAQAVLLFIAFLCQGAAVVVYGIEYEEASEYFHVSYFGCCVSAVLCLIAGCFALCGRRK